MKSAKVMFANEVRTYAVPDEVAPNDLVVIEGSTGFVTASVLEVGNAIPDAFPVAAWFNFEDYARKVNEVKEKQVNKNRFREALAMRVNQLTDEEIAEKFPELFDKPAAGRAN